MEPEPIAPVEVKLRMETGEAVAFLDSRSDEAWQKAEWQIPNSRRVPPNDVEAHLDEIPRRGLVVPYCSCPHEESSLRVAQTLAQRGWTNARPLLGGIDAWRLAGYPAEAKPTRRQPFSEVAANLRKAEGNDNTDQ